MIVEFKKMFLSAYYDKKVSKLVRMKSVDEDVTVAIVQITVEEP